MLYKCDNCGVEFKINPSRLKNKTICCSRKCAKELKIKQNLNCKCEVCGKLFHRKPYHINKTKHLCCSKECANILKQTTYKGENNHQYGLKGELNSSYKGHNRKLKNGYYWVRVPNHPFCTDNYWVREHRIIAEKYLLNEENSIIINGQKYLSPEYDVHHINFDKLDNRVENLIVLTRSEHQKLHHKLKK